MIRDDTTLSAALTHLWATRPTAVDDLESAIRLAMAYSIRGCYLDGDELLFEPTAVNDGRVFRVRIELEEVSGE